MARIADSKRHPIPLYMVDILNAYQATGRVVSVYPYRGAMSLNGGPSMSYDKAHNKMRECLDRMAKVA